MLYRVSRTASSYRTPWQQVLIGAIGYSSYGFGSYSYGGSVLATARGSAQIFLVSPSVPAACSANIANTALMLSAWYRSAAVAATSVQRPARLQSNNPRPLVLLALYEQTTL